MERHRIETTRAGDLGSAKSGFAHWWVERVTAVALLPLSVWFAASLIGHSASDHGTFVRWLGEPFNAILMILLLIALFWHTALGLQVVIEDYVHSSMKIWVVLATRIFCFAMPAAGIMATLRISLEVI